MTEKQTVREKGIMARRGMRPEERVAASMEIARKIAASDEFKDADTVLIYRAMPDEVDLDFLAKLPEAEGKRICYDEDGNRMGMGGGYYDRYLPKCGNAIIAAVAFEAQKALTVPVEETDIPMDMIFTESGVCRRHDAK